MGETPFFALSLVLTAAILHAVWNALIKGASDRLLTLGLIASGSTLLAQKRQALFMEERRYKFRTKWAEAEFRERLHLATQKLYNEIQQWIAKYAEKQGYDLILKIDRRPLAAKTQEEMKLKIHTRTVIYRRKALDLTDHVIKLLNQ